MIGHSFAGSETARRRPVAIAVLLAAATAGLLTSSTYAVASAARAATGPAAAAQLSSAPANLGSQAELPNPNLCSATLTLPGACPQLPASSGNSAPFGQSQPTNTQDASPWSIVPSPNTRGETTLLLDVTCVAASDCWAVGGQDTEGAGQSLIERWDGASWTVVPSADTSASQTNELINVTCVAASDCWAVGGYVNSSNALQTLVEHWDGSVWGIVPSADTSADQSNELLSTTCVSASDCWAVGGYVNASNTVQTLVERWDGTSWAIVPSPDPSTTHYSVMQGVTCVTTPDCWAVGYYISSTTGSGTIGAYQTLIERWDGSSWTIFPSINVGAQENYLNGVTCVSASDCWAVGEYKMTFAAGPALQTLIERWDGTSWAVAVSANTSPTDEDSLNGVTCISASDCWAVGGYNTGDATLVVAQPARTLVERWDGTSWTIVPVPDRSAAQDPAGTNPLAGVTCVATSDCWAVGYSSDRTDQIHTFVERWDGSSWVITSSPNSGDVTQANNLDGVTCVSTSDCWAVGFSSSNAFPYAQTLIERWNGASWAIVLSPPTSAVQTHQLRSVTCVAASDCWAVGFVITYTFAPAVVVLNEQTLTEHWDGTSWAIVPSANTMASSAGEGSLLSGVTCVAVSDCWAVGFSTTSGVGGQPTQTLIEKWDGTSWTVVPSPDSNTAQTQENSLASVTCVTASDCWAVGNADIWYSSSDQTVIEHWDGTSWATVPSAAISGSEGWLLGVSCVTQSDCWAVGGYLNTSNALQTLVERWDGTSWTMSAYTTQRAFLFGVTCVSELDCWAVGDTFVTGTSSTTYQTLIERWDGASWAIVPSPNTVTQGESPVQGDFLFGVACPDASTCWTVGDGGNLNQGQTLAEEYGSPSAQVPEAPWVPFLVLAGAGILATRRLCSRRRRCGC